MKNIEFVNLAGHFHWKRRAHIFGDYAKSVRSFKHTFFPTRIISQVWMQNAEVVVWSNFDKKFESNWVQYVIVKPYYSPSSAVKQWFRISKQIRGTRQGRWERGRPALRLRELLSPSTAGGLQIKCLTNVLLGFFHRRRDEELWPLSSAWRPHGSQRARFQRQTHPAF